MTALVSYAMATRATAARFRALGVVVNEQPDGTVTLSSPTPRNVAALNRLVRTVNDGSAEYRTRVIDNLRRSHVARGVRDDGGAA